MKKIMFDPSLIKILMWIKLSNGSSPCHLPFGGLFGLHPYLTIACLRRYFLKVLQRLSEFVCIVRVKSWPSGWSGQNKDICLSIKKSMSKDGKNSPAHLWAKDYILLTLFHAASLTMGILYTFYLPTQFSPFFFT